MPAEDYPPGLRFGLLLRVISSPAGPGMYTGHPPLSLLRTLYMHLRMRISIQESDRLPGSTLKDLK
jgi:hypothetical protein